MFWAQKSSKTMDSGPQNWNQRCTIPAVLELPNYAPNLEFGDESPSNQILILEINPFALGRRFAVAELWRFLVALFIDRFLPFFSGLCSIQSAV
jgi:hypothetical protein